MVTTIEAQPRSTAGAALAVKSAVDRPDARYRDGDSLMLTVDVTEDACLWSIRLRYERQGAPDMELDPDEWSVTTLPTSVVAH